MSLDRLPRHRYRYRLSKMITEEFIEAKKQFDIAVQAARAIRIRVWSVYRLDQYEKSGISRTQFSFQYTKPSLEEALMSVSCMNISFIVHEYLAVDGTRWFLHEEDDTRTCDKGTPLYDDDLLACKLTQSAKGYLYDGKNDWIRARITRNGVAHVCAEAIAYEQRPSNWQTQKYNESSDIHILFDSELQHSTDEEREEDYDY